MTGWQLRGRVHVKIYDKEFIYLCYSYHCLALICEHKSKAYTKRADFQLTMGLLATLWCDGVN